MKLDNQSDPLENYMLRSGTSFKGFIPSLSAQNTLIPYET